MLLPPESDSVLARFARNVVHPGKGWCFRCGFPWGWVDEHVTYYRQLEGCFALCKGCWAELGSPGARISYYKMLIDSWELSKPVDPDKKKDIQMAVANGE